MKAFHGDPAIKAKYLDRVRQHRLADNLVQGTGWEDGKGCAIGCTFEEYDHMLAETEIGVPVMLARLEDAIFEGLQNADAQIWPERFLSAAPVGADLSKVGWQFLHWLMLDLAEKPYAADARDVILQTAAVLENPANRLPIDSVAAYAARAVAYAANSYAADAADAATAYAAAAATAYAASRAATAAAYAADAADAATTAAAYAASRAAAVAAVVVGGAAEYKRYADKLIELMEAA